MRSEVAGKFPRGSGGARAPRRVLRLLLAALLAPLAQSCACEDPTLQEVEVALRLDPAELLFEPVPVGGADEESVFVLNDGNSGLELDGELAIEGEGAAAFEIVDRGTFPVPGQGSTIVYLRFVPPAEGRFEAKLQVPAASPAEPGAVTLIGEGEPAAIELSPEELAFGELEAGQTATQEITVANLDEVGLSVALTVEGGGFLLEGGRRIDLPLEAGESRTLSVRFLPDRGGDFEGAVRAELCGPGCGPAVALSGVGLAPRIDVEPRPVDFGEVAAGESLSLEVSVKNRGVGNLVIEEVALNDASGWLALGEVEELPRTLSGDASLSVPLTYAPEGPDGEFTATLLLTSSDPLQPNVAVPITAVTPGAAVRVLPEAANYGLLDPGVERDLELLALSVGTAPVEIIDIRVQGGAFSLIGPPPLVPIELAPTESLLLPVRAAADPDAVAAGGAEGTLEVTTADGQVASSSLAFTSGENGCQPRAEQGNLNLGFMRLGEGSSGQLFVTNIGTETCTEGDLQPASALPFDPGFDWEVIDTDLEAGATLAIPVAFTASSEGQSRAFFELSFAEREAPLLLSATATGLLGTLSPQPAGVELGPGTRGCPGERRTITFVNDSAGPVTAEAIELAPPTPEVTISHGELPAQIEPGAGFEVRVEAQNQSVGLAQTTVVVDTLEVGHVSAWVTSDVRPEGQPVTETFLVGEGSSAVDILFIIDNSGSMEDDQQQLAENFAQFIAEAGTGVETSDFHIAVTSTDVLDENALRGRFVGPPTVMTNSTPSLEQVFADHASLGAEGAGLELGLSAMQLALDRPLSNTANAGFHRPEAALSVIVVSDEDDAGDTVWVRDFFPEHHRSVLSYVEFLSSVKGGVLTETPILFSAVVRAGSSPRYTEMVNEFGGIVLDINQPDWGSNLAEIGSATFGINARFTLASEPDPGSVSVLVDGVPTTDFTLDPGGRSIVLGEPPPPGATVEVTYVPSC